MTAAWQPSTEDLGRMRDEQNPWARLRSVPSSLAPPVERPLGQMLWRRLVSDDLPRRFHLVLGPRRVGKTTVLYQTVRHLLEDLDVPPWKVWWLRLDHPLLVQANLGDLVRAVTERADQDDPAYLFLDELVYARDWDLWLKTFYDERWPVHIVASSSASAAMAERRPESGVGRWQEHLLMPYLLSERLHLAGRTTDLRTSETFADTIDRLLTTNVDYLDLSVVRDDLLLLGGFPELLALGDPADGRIEDRLISAQQTLRVDAVERTIYKDIPQSFGVDSPLQLERLLYVIAGQVGGVLSPTRISQQLGLSQPTVDRYISYLERSFVIFTLPNYSGSESNVQRRGRKVYFYDAAVRNAALQRGIAPLSDPEELGMLRENLAVAHVHAMASATGARCFHWRSGNAEVDLILEGQGRSMALEFASSASHHRRGLRALLEAHPELHGSAFLVAPNASVAAPDPSSGIGTLPLDLFLLAASEQTAAALEQGLAS